MYVFFLPIILIIIAALYCLVPEDKLLYQKNSDVDCDKVEVRQSEHGLGCFAACDIKKGEIIEKGIITPMPGVDGNLHSHMFTWDNDRKLFGVGSGCLPFYNHSETPNIIKIGNLKTDRLNVEALCDIKKGTELRNRYMSKSWRGCFQSF